ncbi:putative nucleoside-diphosphate-sugar epimerase [Neohortaea acidophila]|uniref:Putative nucleoside-diphosphate-sugar epimerase n=1 Tax=Neohortaea acidophila TaxID=245834 RepID=A0A6A6PGR8_9PEZI|nr:putative nucleoside-diphosphate-sugar epimerase [Neohortaea acidophila]KAF2479198.1 putative nucleoside-diphosphate-sugar epimerase [Neohortaea acidophila]
MLDGNRRLDGISRCCPRYRLHRPIHRHQASHVNLTSHFPATSTSLLSEPIPIELYIIPIPTMKILITGAGGFLGQLLAEHLLKEQHHLVLTDIFEPPVPAGAAAFKQNVTSIKADILADPHAVLSPDLNAAYIFHGIMSAGSEENLDLGYSVNLHSSMALIEAIRKTCPGIRVVYASSCAAYGQPLPHNPSETNIPTPQGSYGTQKVMMEYFVNDYSRRGYIDAITLRFPTISVRPGKPSAAASSWMSGIIREPLQGQEADLPCPDDFECWLGSPKILAQNLMIALKLPSDCMPPHIRQINVPGITATVGEMLAALKKVGGEEAVKLVKRKPLTPDVKAVLESWSVRFDVSKALGLGMLPEQPFVGAVEDFAASLKK